MQTKQQIKLLLLCIALTTFLGCNQQSNKPVNKATDVIHITKTERYVSMDCHKGDITLTLDTNNTFDLTILFWDSVARKHTGQESVKGHWSKGAKKLTLTTSDNNKIIYELSTTFMKIGSNEINATTYGFKSSDKDFFASGINLLDQEQTDSFLLKASKEKK